MIKHQGSMADPFRRAPVLVSVIIERTCFFNDIFWWWSSSLRGQKQRKVAKKLSKIAKNNRNSKEKNRLNGNSNILVAVVIENVIIRKISSHWSTIFTDLCPSPRWPWRVRTGPTRSPQHRTRPEHSQSPEIYVRWSNCTFEFRHITMTHLLYYT